MLKQGLAVACFLFTLSAACFAETPPPQSDLQHQISIKNPASALGAPSPHVKGEGKKEESSSEEKKEIAITIDDLPFVASGTNTPANLKRTQDRFMAIVNALAENHVPATGFIIAGAIAKNEWPLLEAFKNQGFNLGNHTYTHKSLNSLSAEKYIADIDKADQKLATIMTEPKYFRFPYLAEGKGEKKQQVRDYLSAHQYTIAPVTIDSKDYSFNAQFYRIPYRSRPKAITQFKKRYLAFIWQQTLKAERKAQKIDGHPVKQILLLHANLLNSLCLADIIALYKEHGYTFISLADALKGNVAPPINNEAHNKKQEKTPTEEVLSTTSLKELGFLNP